MVGANQRRRWRTASHAGPLYRCAALAHRRCLGTHDLSESRVRGGPAVANAG